MNSKNQSYKIVNDYYSKNNTIITLEVKGIMASYDKQEISRDIRLLYPSVKLVNFKHI